MSVTDLINSFNPAKFGHQLKSSNFFFVEIIGIISPIGLGLKFYVEWLSFGVKIVYFDEKSHVDVIPKKKF